MSHPLRRIKTEEEIDRSDSAIANLRTFWSFTTREEVLKKLDISATYLYSILSGTASPSIELIEKIENIAREKWGKKESN